MSNTQEHFQLANIAFAIGDIDVFKKYFPTIDEYNNYSGRGEKSTYLLPALFFPQYWDYAVSEGYDLLQIFDKSEPYFLLSDEITQKIFKSNPSFLKNIFDNIYPFVEDDTPITESSLEEYEVDSVMDDFYSLDDTNKEIMLDYFTGDLQQDLSSKMNRFLYSPLFYKEILLKLSKLFPNN